jgi:hypothetical protein
VLRFSGFQVINAWFVLRVPCCVFWKDGTLERWNDGMVEHLFFSFGADGGFFARLLYFLTSAPLRRGPSPLLHDAGRGWTGLE